MECTKGKKDKKGLHILAGLSQDIATSTTFMVGCPAQPYKTSLPQSFYLHHANDTVFTVGVFSSLFSTLKNRCL